MDEHIIVEPIIDSGPPDDVEEYKLVTMTSEQRVKVITLLEKLKETIENSITDRSDVFCHLVENQEVPFLTVFTGFQDPWLLDFGNVRLQCEIDLEMRLKCSILSYNRNSVSSFFCHDTEENLLPLIREMAEGLRFKTCLGFDCEESPLFKRLRKQDISSVLIERYGEKTTFRSKSCQFVIDAKDCKDIGDQCAFCLKLESNLDEKYPLFVKPTKVKQEVPVQRDIVKKEPLLSDEETDQTDLDFVPRRSSRKRSTFIFSDGEPTKRRRGRPPSKPGPLICSHCDATFILLKEFKRHIVSFKTIILKASGKNMQIFMQIL